MVMVILAIIVTNLVLFVGCLADNAELKLLIVINCNDHPYHLNHAKLTQRHIQMQAKDQRSKLAVEVLLATEMWPDVPGLWTFQPILTEVLDLYGGDNYNWLLISTEYTEVNLTALHQILIQYDSSKPQFLGRALKDDTRAIIHHYADTDFYFPDSMSGVLVSWTLLEQQREETHDFNIDAKYELAKSFYNNGRGTSLTDVEEFCSPTVTDAGKCATLYRYESLICPAGSTHKPVTADDVFVLVKTGEVYHHTRVQQQLSIWTHDVKHIEICSEKEDLSIPTVKVDAINTEIGHCAKFHAILKRALSKPHINSKRWVVVVDDDTLMNVTRLTSVLSCYDDSAPVVLGERYGYQTRGRGYDYITGGGGTVLNAKAVAAVINGGFSCSRADAPDDMKLGSALRRLDIPIQHSVLFHQAPPSAYAPDYVEPQRNYAVSFHKLQPDDPVRVAKDWLGIQSASKPQTGEDNSPSPPQHNEL